MVPVAQFYHLNTRLLLSFMFQNDAVLEKTLQVVLESSKTHAQLN